MSVTVQSHPQYKVSQYMSVTVQSHPQYKVSQYMSVTVQSHPRCRDSHVQYMRHKPEHYPSTPNSDSEELEMVNWRSFWPLKTWASGMYRSPVT
jgi:hypothetical protein